MHTPLLTCGHCHRHLWPQFYATAQRAELVEANPESSSADINKLLGQAWKELADDERQPYMQLAAVRGGGRGRGRAGPGDPAGAACLSAPGRWKGPGPAAVWAPAAGRRRTGSQCGSGWEAGGQGRHDGAGTACKPSFCDARVVGGHWPAHAFAVCMLQDVPHRPLPRAGLLMAGSVSCPLRGLS